MILIFGDLHLDFYRRFSHILPGGMNSRLNEQVEVIKKIMDLSIPELSAIIFLGDFFNGQGSSIQKQLYLTGYNIIESLSKLAPLYLLSGNHDIYGATNILTPFKSIKNVNVISHTVTETIDGLPLTLVPWGGSIPVNGDILLGHLDIEGAKNGIGYSLPGTITISEVKDYSLIISGHWHTRQWVNPTILYCGAVMPHDFGDVANLPFGITLLHKDRTLDFVPIPSPTFISIIINNEKDMGKFEEQWRDQKTGDYFKLIIKDRKIKIPKFDHTVDVEWDVVEKVENRLEYTSDETMEEVLCKFIDLVSTQADKALSKKYLLEIMKEC